MNQIELEFKKLTPTAKEPVYSTKQAACFDIFADGTSRPHKTDPNAIVFGTGLAVAIPAGWALKLYSRSGQGFNDAIRLSNCVGIIDADYREEIMVSLRFDSLHKEIKAGDRIVQGMLEPAPQVKFRQVDELSETDRKGGFGSTGV